MNNFFNHSFVVVNLVLRILLLVTFQVAVGPRKEYISSLYKRFTGLEIFIEYLLLYLENNITSCEVRRHYSSSPFLARASSVVLVVYRKQQLEEELSLTCKSV